MPAMDDDGVRGHRERRPSPRARVARNDREALLQHPGFRVRDRLFARIREERDVLVVWCESIEEKELLIASEPAAPRRLARSPSDLA
jgi:hypothetical protein